MTAVCELELFVSGRFLRQLGFFKVAAKGLG